MDWKELANIIIALVGVSLALAIFFTKPSFDMFWQAMTVVTPVMGISFVLHELAHRTVAINKGHNSYFQASWWGIPLSIFIAYVAPIVFILPGGAMIEDQMTDKELARTAVAGPVIDIFATAFFVPFLIYGTGTLAHIGFLGILISPALALFNLLPIPPLDGHKVITGNAYLWVLTVTVSAFVLLTVYNILFMGNPIFEVIYPGNIVGREVVPAWIGI